MKNLFLNRIAAVILSCMCFAHGAFAEGGENSGMPGSVDCQYTLPDPLDKVSSDIVLQWADNAVLQTFTYDFQNYDKQFKSLKACYTTTGWDSFNVAMQKANSLKVVQDERLYVAAKINGQSELVSQTQGSSDNKETPSWVVRVPLMVSYQNQDHEVSQDLYVDVTIKAVYGAPSHLGINQIVASQRGEAHALSNAPVPSATATDKATP